MATMLSGSKNRKIVYAFANDQIPLSPIDLYKETKKSGRVFVGAEGLEIKQPEMKDDQTSVLDFNIWLHASSGPYHISSNFEDYILTPVIIMPSDIPNRNAVAFTFQELYKFHPHLGQQAYKTWKGKPTFHEHQNNDITKAYGVIADSEMRQMKGYSRGLCKVLLFLAFDRSKHPDHANLILSGDINSYSMGAYIGSFTCSYCEKDVGVCSHIDPQNPRVMYELNGKLVFRNVRDIEGFETSSVGSPAYVSAISDTLIQVKPMQIL
jgi:hypothetical protein